MPIPTLVIAGTHSGVGKTSIAIGLMRAFTNQGFKVQPFKVGPDFIDPSHHRQATGRISHNLDGWMLNQAQNLQIFDQACEGADLAIVEGVMGLFDGYGAESETGSTAEMAKWLGAPVLLVINARSLARSAAALITGYVNFDPDVTVAGIICNQIGSASHLERICSAVKQTVKVTILGGIPRTEPVKIPRRHLGLWRANEDQLVETDYLEDLAKLVTDNLDLEGLVNIAKSMSERSATVPVQALDTSSYHKPKVRIGIAQDQAFCFYYVANLQLLEQAGAELVPFSPLEDTLPKDLAGLYIGGGYPELYAEQLVKNEEMREAIANFCASGRPIYAECGGLMYLSQGLLGMAINSTDSSYPFVGIFPFWTKMGTRVKLGYRQVEMIGSYDGFPNQEKIRGHRFHYSDIVDAEGNLLDITPESFSTSLKEKLKLKINYQLQGWNTDKTLEGYQINNVLVSYVHLHFGSNPSFAQRFVQFCRSYSVFKS